MLQTRMLCVCELTEALGLAASTVSNHCKILKEAGFIIEEKDGKWVNYGLNPAPEDNRIPKFLTDLDFWLKDSGESLKWRDAACNVDRNVICCR
ncbi:MAG: hypothetical protein AMXMBFR48_30290 [Ignavibacteriales bacterium]